MRVNDERAKDAEIYARRIGLPTAKDFILDLLSDREEYERLRMDMREMLKELRNLVGWRHSLGLRIADALRSLDEEE